MVYDETFIEYQDLLLYTILILSLFLISILLLDYLIEERVNKQLMLIYKETDFFKNKKLFLILKLLACFFIPNPFFKSRFKIHSVIFDTDFEYTYNDLMTVFIILRFVILMPVLLNLSFMSDSSY